MVSFTFNSVIPLGGKLDGPADLTGFQAFGTYIRSPHATTILPDFNALQVGTPPAPGLFIRMRYIVTTNSTFPTYDASSGHILHLLALAVVSPKLAVWI